MFICPAVERNHFFLPQIHFRRCAKEKKTVTVLSFFVCRWFVESNHNLTSADHNWKLSQSPTRRPFFGHSHTAPTPSIYTIQQLVLTTTHAFSNLIRHGIHTFIHPPTAPKFDFHSFIIPEDTYVTAGFTIFPTFVALVTKKTYVECT